MKSIGIVWLLAGLVQSLWAARVGEPAPAFELKDLQGNPHSLAKYKGRTVVLEWFNLGCPFVQKHYGSGNMQGLQGKYVGKGVVWLGIRTGDVDAEALAAMQKKLAVRSSAWLLDASGEVARAFGARATPHVFVVGPGGRVVYSGAVDDKPTPDPATVAGARNYVAEALDAILAGRKIPVPVTRPYGCGVKYGK